MIFNFIIYNYSVLFFLHILMHICLHKLTGTALAGVAQQIECWPGKPKGRRFNS